MRLKEALTKEKFVVTSEVQAPLDEEPQELIKRLQLVRGRVDGIAVPELEVEGIVGDSIKICELLKQNRFESIYQTTTRDKNRPQLQKDLQCTSGGNRKSFSVYGRLSDYRRQSSGNDVLSCGCRKIELRIRPPERGIHH